jgi:hypothetical protein
VHVAVTGTTMHWIADAAGLASSGSVFPGYPDHVDEDERREASRPSSLVYFVTAFSSARAWSI